MKKTFLAVLPPLMGLLLLAAGPELKFDPMPAPLTNNAVASFKGRDQFLFFSFMGIGPKKTWDAVSNATYILDAYSGKWGEARPVPGTAGRLGASAVTARDHVFLLGGYVLDSKGAETTLPDVNAYEPDNAIWFRGEDIPVPVSASVAGVYRDRYIYLISGWAKAGPVQNVQMYDAEKNQWQQATTIPGTAVFGHAGGIVDDTIIYVDGAYRNSSGAFVASNECWLGKIQHKDPAKIEWSKLPPHPGDARFRIAAGASEKDNKIYFTGGAAAPYTTRGIGFDGQPATPSATTFAFNLHTGKWETIPQGVPALTMDQRGLLVTSQGLVLLGGMDKGGAVIANVTILNKK
ncbi:MAG TPA: hypothetical protein VGF06_02125 [Terriglobales bacterium]